MTLGRGSRAGPKGSERRSRRAPPVDWRAPGRRRDSRPSGRHRTKPSAMVRPRRGRCLPRRVRASIRRRAPSSTDGSRGSARRSSRTPQQGHSRPTSARCRCSETSPRSSRRSTGSCRRPSSGSACTRSSRAGSTRATPTGPPYSFVRGSFVPVISATSRALSEPIRRPWNRIRAGTRHSPPSEASPRNPRSRQAPSIYSKSTTAELASSNTSSSSTRSGSSSRRAMPTGSRSSPRPHDLGRTTIGRPEQALTVHAGGRPDRPTRPSSHSIRSSGLPSVSGRWADLEGLVDEIAAHGDLDRRDLYELRLRSAGWYRDPLARRRAAPNDALTEALQLDPEPLEAHAAARRLIRGQGRTADLVSGASRLGGRRAERRLAHRPSSRGRRVGARRACAARPRGGLLPGAPRGRQERRGRAPGALRHSPSAVALERGRRAAGAAVGRRRGRRARAGRAARWGRSIATTSSDPRAAIRAYEAALELDDRDPVTDERPRGALPGQRPARSPSLAARAPHGLRQRRGTHRVTAPARPALRSTHSATRPRPSRCSGKF